MTGKNTGILPRKKEMQTVKVGTNTLERILGYCPGM